MGPAGRLVTIKRSGADGAHFPLSLRTCLFGRGVECDIRIQLPVVSKQHCKIEISEREAMLYNFSSMNPTQVNGSVIDEPVPLKHGDVITIIDRSFRYENDSHQNGSESTEFPGKIRGQEPARRASRASFSADPDWKDQDSRVHSKITEGNASGRPLVHVKKCTGDSPASRGSEDSIAQQPAGACSSAHNGRNAEDPASGDFKRKSRVTVSSYGELKSFPSPQCLDNSKKNESPFEKLYQSMKEELDVKPQRQNELQYRRKSSCAIEKESADGLQRESQLLVPHKSRPKSGRSTLVRADPSLELAPSQPEGKGKDVQPVRTSKEAVCSGLLPCETKMAPTQQSQKHKDGDLSTVDGREPMSLRPTEGATAVDKTATPQRLLARNQTPAKDEGAASPGSIPKSLSSRKRRSMPTNVEVPSTEIQSKPFLTQCLAQVGKKILKDPLNKPERLGTTAGQICSVLPGLSSVDISNFGNPTNKSEDVPLKRRRVSFGGCLRPELFDENLPPNTPLKRGETPAKRKSHLAHTPAALKKIIKEQPPSPGRESSSEICLEVKAQDMCAGAPALGPRASPGTGDQRRRSSKAAAASSGGRSPHQTEVAKKGRKSGHLSSKRASLSRSQHGILQMICSRRRSGASEANLIVAKSWADVVKLGAKQTQTRVIKHGPQRQTNKRQRRANTPKKPMENTRSQFSTGHANSPCTIIIGKAQIEKVNVPARPYRMLNNLVFNRKLDYNEDLSGLTEMFKTPIKEKHQVTSECPGTLPGSEGLLREKYLVTNSGKKPRPITSEILGESVFSSMQYASKESFDKCSASPTLRRKSIKAGESMLKTPRSIDETTRSEMKTPDSTTQPLKAVSSVNKSRKSAELRKAQVPPVERKSETEANVPESLRGRQARKTPLRAKEEERGGEECESSSDTWKESIQSTGSFGKTAGVRRSGRTGGWKYEPTEDLAGRPALLQTPHRATDTVNNEGDATETPCRSSQPEPVHPASGGRRQSRTALGKADAKEEVSTPRPPALGSGQASHTRSTPRGGRRSRLLEGTPEQRVEPAVHGTGAEKRPRTPKQRTQSLEDLTGFKELFQTPKSIEESITDGKRQVPCKSPQPAAATTKARPSTPRRRMDSRQPLEGLAGLQQLFQTPGCANDPNTADQTAKTPCTSLQPETVRAPAALKRRSRSSLEILDLKEEPPARSTPGRATSTPTVPAQEEKCIKASTETTEQTPDRIKNVTGFKRRSKSSKEKAQPLEDLAGLQELFQTPGHARNPKTAGETQKTPCKSPQPGPVDTPAASKRRASMSLGRVGVKEEHSTLWTPAPPARSPDRATHVPTVPAQEERGAKVSTESPEQTLDQAENVAGLKRQSKTPKKKAQPLEDLAGLQELFQMPGHARNPKAAGETPKTPCRSSQPGPVDTPAASKRRASMSLGRVGVKEEHSTLWTPARSPDRATHMPTVPAQEERGAKVSTESPKQTLDQVENVAGLKRRSKTPKKKAQPLEDLAGLQELFQTPGHARNPNTADQTAKTPGTSLQPETVRAPAASKRRPRTSLEILDLKEEPSARSTPTVPAQERCTRASTETPKQTLDQTKNVTGLKRRSETPKGKDQPREDLASLQELFQTPGRARNPETTSKTPKTPCRSPEPVDTPAASKRRASMSLGKVNVKEESLPQSPGKAMRAARVPAQEEKHASASTETPKQTPDPTENVSDRKKRTPKAKAQPLEDLAGFQELFRTPVPTSDPKPTDDIVNVPYKSPRPEPLRTPTSTKRGARLSLRRVDVKREVSVPGKLAQMSGEATPSAPGGGDKHVEVFEDSAEQTLEPAARVTSSKRLRGAPKEKAQPLEDLAGIQELFQTPASARNPIIDEKIMKIPGKSPGPVGTLTASKRWARVSLGKVDVKGLLDLRIPAQSAGRAIPTPVVPVQEEKHTRASMDAPKQTLDLTEDVTGLRRLSRTPKEKAQPLEDLTGLQELFQTPDCARNPVTAGETPKMPCKSPRPQQLRTLASTKRLPRMSLGKVDVEEEVSLLRKFTQTSREAMRTCGTPRSNGKGMEVLEESAKQTLEPAASITGRRRQSRAPKEKAQPLEDLAGLQELFQTPGRANHPNTADQTAEMPFASLQPETVRTPVASKRRSRSSLERVDVEDERSALGTPGQSPGRARHAPTVPARAERYTKAYTETSRQTPDQIRNVTKLKRRSKTPKEKAQPPEDLAGLQELFETPGHAKNPKTAGETPKTPCKSPQPGPVDTPAASKRRAGMSLGRVGVKEEHSAVREHTHTSGEASPRRQQSMGEGKGAEVAQKPAKRKLDAAEDGTGSKRLRGTPKEKAQLLEDLAGFQELFQTPEHTKESRGDDGNAKMPCKPLVDTPPASQRQPRTRLRKADVAEERSAQGKVTATSAETRNTEEPEGDRKDATVPKVSAKRKLDPAVSVAGGKRLRGALEEKALPLGDLAAPKEPTHTPGHSEEATRVPRQSPNPGPAGSPASTQTGPRTRLRKVTVNVKEDPSGVRKPTRATRRTPGVPEGRDGGTEAPEPSVVRKATRRTPGVPEALEPSVVRKPTQASRRTPRVPEGRDGGTEAPEPSGTRKLMRAARPEDRGGGTEAPEESAKQALGPAAGAAVSRRLRGAPRGKAQLLEDLAGPKEPVQTPGHSEESRSDEKNTKIPFTSPQLEPVATRPTSQRQLRIRLGRAGVAGRSAQGKVQGTLGESTDTQDPQLDGGSLQVFKAPAKRKLDPAANVTGSKRLREAPKEKASPLGDVAGSHELFQAPGHTGESRHHEEAARARVPRQSPHPGPAGSPASTQTGPSTRLRKVPVKEEPAVVRKPTRATRHTPRVPEGTDRGIKAPEESAKQVLGPAAGAAVSRRLRGAPRGKAQPLEDLAGPKEPVRSPGHPEELGKNAHSLKSSPEQAPNTARPLTTSRRVLRAPKGKSEDDLIDRDPAASQSHASLLSKAKSGEDGRIPGTRGLRPMTAPQEARQVKPAPRTQRAAPRQRAKSPELLKKDLRIFTNRIEPAEGQKSNMKTEKGEYKADLVTSDKGISLRSRQQNKSDGEEKKPELTVLAENVKIKRNVKKPAKTSQDTELLNPEDGAKKLPPGGKVNEISARLRPGRQNKASQPQTASEKVLGKGVGVPVQNQQDKGATENPGVGLRSRRTGIQPGGSTLERESEKRVTRGAKRCAENPKKDKDIVYTTGTRSRSRRVIEDI